MKPASPQETSLLSEALYPMSRQELAVPAVPWIRLRGEVPDTPGHDNFANAAKRDEEAAPSQIPPERENAGRSAERFDDVQIPSNATSTLADRRPNAPLGAKVRTDDPIASSTASSPGATNSEAKNAGSKSSDVKYSDASVRDASVRDAKVRSDQPTIKPKIAAPKFLKHAVRFGGPGVPLPSEQQTTQQARIGHLQSAQKSQVSTQDIVTLHGVDCRGQAYAIPDQQPAPQEAARIVCASGASQSALEHFLQRQASAIEAMPVIERETRAAAEAPVLDAAPALSSEDQPSWRFWLQALIQIVLGTLIMIALMNLNHWLRSNSRQQLIEQPISPTETFPVRQANTLQPESLVR